MIFFGLETNEPYFKVTHLGKQMKVKSAGFISNLAILDKGETEDGEKQEFAVRALHENEGKPNLNYHFILFNENVFDQSFVVETIPRNSDFDCFKSDPAVLKPAECKGMRLRQPNKDDY